MAAEAAGRSSYKEQAIGFLNAFWDQGASRLAENVWQLCSAFVAADSPANCGLDDAGAQRFFASEAAAGLQAGAFPQRPLSLVAVLLSKCACF